MASLKEMRNRISSVKATQKITKAMQMVAAAKLRWSQEAAEAARPYARRLASVIANLAAGVSGDGAPALLTGTGRDDRHLIIVAARAGQHLRRAVAGHARGQVGDHARQTPSIGTRGFRRVLAPAQLGRRHHLHRFRDLLRGFHARDPIAHFL